MHACTEEGRNNYSKTLIQTGFHDCTYVYTCCDIIQMCITIHIIYWSLHPMDVSDNRTLLHLHIQTRSRARDAEPIHHMSFCRIW